MIVIDPGAWRRAYLHQGVDKIPTTLEGGENFVLGMFIGWRSDALGTAPNDGRPELLACVSVAAVILCCRIENQATDTADLRADSCALTAPG